MIKVIHFVNTLRRGGIERQVYNICQKSNNIINLVITLYFPANSYFSVNNDSVYHISDKSIIKRIELFNRYVQKEKPNIIFAWSNLPYWIAKVNQLRNNNIVINGSVQHGIFQSTFSNYFRFITLHISKYIIANNYAGLRANKLSRGRVLYNGIGDNFDVKKYKQDYSLRSKMDIAEEDIVLVSIANLVPYKDYETVFKALEKLRINDCKFKYIIMGDGPLRNKYEKMLLESNLHNNVILAGSVCNPEKFLSIGDIFIHSSLGEGCSNAILEAMYMGLPIIATDTGGTSEIVNKNNSFLFQYGNSEELLNYLSLLLSDKKQMKEMGNESYKIVTNRFTLRKMIEKYESYMRNINQ